MDLNNWRKEEKKKFDEFGDDNYWDWSGEPVVLKSYLLERDQRLLELIKSEVEERKEDVVCDCGDSYFDEKGDEWHTQGCGYGTSVINQALDDLLESLNRYE